MKCLELIERIRAEVIGVDDPKPERTQPDRYGRPRYAPGVSATKQVARNELRANQRTALNRIKSEVEGKGE